MATTTAGYATHGLLDACTSYGTRLLWPSPHRVAWDVISIIDPLFTLMLLVGLVWAVWSRSRAPAAVALTVCALYLGLGALRRERAMAAQERIAAARGHTPDRGAVFPAVGSNLVWRSLYRVGERLHADRIRVSWLGAAQWAGGSELQAVSEREMAGADVRVVAAFRRFRWFAADWTVRAPADPSWIADARYSLRMDMYDPIWGIRFHPGRPVPIEWVDRSRERRLALRELWAELAGTHPAYRPLPGASPDSNGQPQTSASEKPTSSRHVGPTRQEGGQEPQQQEEGAQPVDRGDAGEVGELAEGGGAQAAEAEREAIEHPRRQAYPAG